MLQKYQQTTGESCLATDLLQLIGKKITRQAELDLLFNALKLDRENYVLSHLNYSVKKYDLKFEAYFENKSFFEFVKASNKSKKIEIKHHKIDLKFIDKKIAVSPAIVYIDTWTYWHINHAAHFIIVFKKVKNGYKIYDPWDGKTRIYPSRVLSQSIIKLRNHIKNSPVLIQKIED